LGTIARDAKANPKKVMTANKGLAAVTYAAEKNVIAFSTEIDLKGCLELAWGSTARFTFMCLTASET